MAKGKKKSNKDHNHKNTASNKARRARKWEANRAKWAGDTEYASSQREHQKLVSAGKSKNNGKN